LLTEVIDSTAMTGTFPEDYRFERKRIVESRRLRLFGHSGKPCGEEPARCGLLVWRQRETGANIWRVKITSFPFSDF